MAHTHDAPRNSLEAYEALVPSQFFVRVRDNLALLLAEVREVHSHVNPVMVTLEYILQAEGVHKDEVYAAVGRGDQAVAIREARRYFQHVGLDADFGMRNRARLEFDAMRRWAVPGSREGAEVFWLGEFTALYSAPYDHDFLDALSKVVGLHKLGQNYEMTFARGSKEHDATGRQFNSLMTHVKFFSM
jgi:hypothetical protein